MRDLDDVFPALARSAFRRRFALGAAERDYLHTRGLSTVLDHARDFVARRLAPASPPNDGKQTPWRGHPVFVAQHATGTCCRGCLATWHDIPRGHALDDAERAHVVRAIERWLRETNPDLLSPMTHPADQPERADRAERADRKPDVVDEASQESFPASDPPSWEPLHSGTPEPSAPKRDAPSDDASHGVK